MEQTTHNSHSSRQRETKSLGTHGQNSHTNTKMHIPAKYQLKYSTSKAKNTSSKSILVPPHEHDQATLKLMTSLTNPRNPHSARVQATTKKRSQEHPRTLPHDVLDTVAQTFVKAMADHKNETSAIDEMTWQMAWIRVEVKKNDRELSWIRCMHNSVDTLYTCRSSERWIICMKDMAYPIIWDGR